VAKKSRNDSPVLDWGLGLSFFLIAAFAVSAAVRVGPQACEAETADPDPAVEWSGRSGLAAELASS